MPKPGGTGERGYGFEHQRARRAMLSAAIGSPCTRCGVVLEAEDEVDLDHTDDGDAYAGFAHKSCNRSAGAKKGNSARGIGKLGRQSRVW